MTKKYTDFLGLAITVLFYSCAFILAVSVGWMISPLATICTVFFGVVSLPGLALELEEYFTRVEA